MRFPPAELRAPVCQRTQFLSVTGCGRADAKTQTHGVMVQETRLRQLSCRGSTVINQTGATQDTADFPELGQREGILFTCTSGK